jgi:hypothetical protein
MKKTISVDGKKFNAKQIVAATTGQTNGGHMIANLNGHTAYWNYRHDEGHMCPVCEASEANCISVDIDKFASSERNEIVAL